MQVAFRVDASIEIGTGHVMRCLTLARALRARGAECRFLMRDLPGHAGAAVLAEGFGLTLLCPPRPADRPDTDLVHGRWLGVSRDVDAAECAAVLALARPDRLVVDHYALEAGWEAVVRPQGCRVVAIDDLADRPHAAAWLLDQNPGRQAGDYDGLLPPGCVRLIGPRFALLRPEFAAARPAALARRGGAGPASVLVAMGGIDKVDATGHVLAAMAGLDPPLPARMTVVLGGRAPHLARVRALAAGMPFATRVEVDAPDMARLMIEADLAIGAAGVSMLERCCLGLPSVLLVLAHNQIRATEVFSALGAALALGRPDAPDLSARLGDALTRLSDPERLAAMARAAAGLCEGSGTERVADLLSAED